MGWYSYRPLFKTVILHYTISLVAVLVICPRTAPPRIDQALFEMVKVSAREVWEDDGKFALS